MSYKPEFRVVIAGSRDFNDYDLLVQKMDFFLVQKALTHRIVIVSGTANGADKLGERYANDKGYSVSRHPADWNQYGKRAGYLRNEEMAIIAHACVVFWDGESRGTKHMIDICTAKKVPLKIVKYKEVA